MQINYIFFTDGTIAKISNYQIDNYSNQDYYINIWGHYYLSGDTIKAQMICNFGEIIFNSYTTDPILLLENWLIINSKDTLTEIYNENINYKKPLG